MGKCQQNCVNVPRWCGMEWVLRSLHQDPLKHIKMSGRIYTEVPTEVIFKWQEYEELKILLFRSVCIFQFWLHACMIWINFKNENSKYEEKLTHNTCDAINCLRDLKQPCWQTGTMSFHSDTNCVLQKFLSFSCLCYEIVVVSKGVIWDLWRLVWFETTGSSG